MRQNLGRAVKLLRIWKRRLPRTLEVLADVSAIVTLGFLIWGVISLQPTLVRLRPEPIAQLSSFGAFEEVHDVLEETANRPVLWFEGFVTNDGTALASGLALEVALDEPVVEVYDIARRQVTRMLIGFVGPVSTYTPALPASIDWIEPTSYKSLRTADIAGWARLYLPPIPPQSFLQVTLALSPSDAEGLTEGLVARAISGAATVRLVRLGEITKAESAYGDEIPGKPEILQIQEVRFRNAHADWAGVEG